VPIFIHSKIQSLWVCCPGRVILSEPFKKHDFYFSRIRDCRYSKIETLISLESKAQVNGYRSYSVESGKISVKG
jgi:hypothetical protein